MDSPMTRYQEKTRERNKERVTALLKEGAKHFKQLRELTHFSPTTLASILKELQNENKVKKVIFDNSEAYALTGRGEKYYNAIWHIVNSLEEMREKDGGYIYVRPATEWGLSYYQAMNRVKRDDNADFPFLIPNPIDEKGKDKLEELLLPVIAEEIKKYKINLENPKTKVIFALELDTAEFAKFFNKILHFIDVVTNGKDILQDKKLGFSETKYKASLFKRYTYYASKFNDREFESKLEQAKSKLAAEGIKL
jgi:DNA-binding HxlR family transcriptional regulator